MTDSPVRGPSAVGARSLHAEGPGAQALEAKRRRGLRFNELAATVGVAPAVLAAVLAGQMPLAPDEAQRLVNELDLDPALADEFTTIPVRGHAASLQDPTIYRLQEIVLVWGTAIKALIHEEFGDGIMSAIDMTVTVERVANPEGDRVRLVLEGKFLPYRRF